MPTEFGSELFRGHQPMTDAASVRALRQGGAVLVGKTVTVCFGGGDPARTRNPFDTRRTPGGSSSGTAAAVAARMLPVGARHPRARLDHPAGELLRRLCAEAHVRRDQPAGLVLDGLQHGPSRRVRRHAVRHVDHGALHRAARPAAIRRIPDFMAHSRRPRRASPRGSSASTPPAGRSPSPPPRRRSRLISRGSPTQASRSSPAATIRRSRLMKRRSPARRSSGPISTASRCTGRCCNTASATATRCRRACSRASRTAPHITQETYRAALIERDKLRAMHDELAQRADGFITLSSPGPGPIGMDQGSAIFNEASSILGAPAINLPLLAVDRCAAGHAIARPLARGRAPDRRRALAGRGRISAIRPERGVSSPRPAGADR